MIKLKYIYQKFVYISSFGVTIIDLGAYETKLIMLEFNRISEALFSIILFSLFSSS